MWPTWQCRERTRSPRVRRRNAGAQAAACPRRRARPAWLTLLRGNRGARHRARRRLPLPLPLLPKPALVHSAPLPSRTPVPGRCRCEARHWLAGMPPAEPEEEPEGPPKAVEGSTQEAEAAEAVDAAHEPAAEAADAPADADAAAEEAKDEL